jgi:transposase
LVVGDADAAGSNRIFHYRQRYKIENMFGRLKDWRRIHARYDRCAYTFMSAICLAVTVIFWFN